MPKESMPVQPDDQATLEAMVQQLMKENEGRIGYDEARAREVARISLNVMRHRSKEVRQNPTEVLERENPNSS